MSQQFVFAPAPVNVRFSIEPALNALSSLQLLSETEALSGLDAWVYTTEALLSPELRRDNAIFFWHLDGLYPASSLVSGADTIPDLIGQLQRADPLVVRDTLLAAQAELPHRHPERWQSETPPPSAQRLLDDLAAFSLYTRLMWHNGENTDPAITSAAHRLINDPPAMLRFAIAHLETMWDRVFAPEWTRVLPLLEESVEAYRVQDYRGLTAYQAVQAVTGRDLRGRFDHKLNRAETLVFMPNAHIGPYVGMIDDRTTVYVSFGARLPREASGSRSALTRSELLVRLNALGDDTRLRILEMLTLEDELCAQEIIERLNLSQSTVSRHLSQLSASGYVTERRRDSNKCYSLNTERVTDTLRALTTFLSRG